MEPMTIYLAISAATALAQMWSAEKARGANKDALRKIEAIWDKVVPPDFGVKIGDPPEKIFEGLKSPEYERYAGTGEPYKVVGKYVPQLLPHIKEQAPIIAQRTGVGKEGLQAQRDALREYQRIAAAETDPLLAQRLMEARRGAGIEARAKQEALLEQFARRGQLGSGMSMLAQQQAGADAMDRLALDSQRAAAEQYQNRLRAMGESAELGGALSRQDIAEQQTRANALNDFNRRATDNFRETMWRNKTMQNEAQQKALAQAQDIANREAERQRQDRMARNEMGEKQYDRELNRRKMAMEIEQRKFDNAMEIAKGRAGVYQRGGELEAGKYGAYGQAGQGLGEGALKAYIFGKMFPEEKPKKEPYPQPEQYPGGGNTMPYRYPRYNEEASWAEDI